MKQHQSGKNAKRKKQRSQEMAEFITTNQPWIDVDHEELQLN